VVQRRMTEWPLISLTRQVGSLDSKEVETMLEGNSRSTQMRQSKRRVSIIEVVLVSKKRMSQGLLASLERED